MTSSFLISVPVSVVVSASGVTRSDALTKPSTETQIPIMPHARLRNVSASVVEAVDSSEEQAEVGKQDKHMQRGAKITWIFHLILCRWNV